MRGRRRPDRSVLTIRQTHLAPPFKGGQPGRPTGRRDVDPDRTVGVAGDVDLLALVQAVADIPSKARQLFLPWVSISSVSPLLWSNNVPLAFYSGVGDLDHRVGGFTGLSRLVINDLYWGIAPGTPTAAGDGVPLEPDEEHMTRTGPIRFTGGMELARTSRVGTCTLCSELGCDDTVVEEFPGERFTSSVSQGTIVCLMERGLTPPGDCPGP